MRKIFLVKVFLFVILAVSAGCASLKEIDQSQVNHPAMDLHSLLTPARSSYLTNLGTVNQSNKSSGACPSCAH